MMENTTGIRAAIPRPKTTAYIVPQSIPANEHDAASKKMAVFRDLMSWVSPGSAANRE